MYIILIIIACDIAVGFHKNRFRSIKRNALNDGFIVQFLFFLFDDLRYISLFQIIRCISDKVHIKRGQNDLAHTFAHSYLFPEIWVVIMLILEICGMQSVKNSSISCLWLLILPFWRIIDIFVYQINVLLFDPIQDLMTKNYPGARLFHSKGNKYAFTAEQKSSPETDSAAKKISESDAAYKIKSASRTVILLIINMAEYILLFTIIYGIYANKINVAFTYLPYKSFNLFTNLDGPEITNLEESIISVAYTESILGMFMNIICLGRFIGMLPEVNQVGYTEKTSGK